MKTSRCYSWIIAPVALVFFLAVAELPACINKYRTLPNGKTVHIEHSGGVMVGTIDTLALQRQASTLLEMYKRTDSIEYFSDYGAVLIEVGRYREAEEIYRFIEKQKPGLYTTDSNLGTLFELTGHVDSALFRIKRSIALYPASHRGSEWIHVKILEHKLRGSNARLTSSLLGLDFGQDARPANIHHYNLRTLRTQLSTQLFERTKFVKPKDDIVGSLYFDLGNVSVLDSYIEDGLEAYHQAEKYGFKHPLVENRIAALLPMTTESMLMNLWNDKSGIPILPVAFVFVVLAGVIVVRRIRKILRTPKDPEQTDIY